ncbi:MAG: HipA N-terminal domain-containing protein [Actinobacteria bacterium]|nr:HipA N-terminal domain-containing protein [Actinomycetota bacterium]
MTRAAIKLHGVTVGRLWRQGDEYCFAYAPAFAELGLRPFAGLDDTSPDRLYRRSQRDGLWTAFRSRLPQSMRGRSHAARSAGLAPSAFRKGQDEIEALLPRVATNPFVIELQPDA